MRKLITIIAITLILALGFTAVFASGTEELDGRLRIGISKLMVHPALDSIEQGIKDYLSENGINAVYETQTANGEISTASSIAQLFQTEGKDIVVGIATPTAQALANVFSDIPVVFATVTDPESAGLTGLANVAGTSDMVPVKEQLRIIEEVTAANKLGMVYTSAESNGITLMEAMQEACDERGIELVTASVSNSSEVMMAAQSIIDRVDAMYVSTDNTVISAIAALSSVCSENNVPRFLRWMTNVAYKLRNNVGDSARLKCLQIILKVTKFRTISVSEENREHRTQVFERRLGMQFRCFEESMNGL